MRVFDRNFIRADGISRKATGVSRSSKHARAAMCVPDLGEGEGTFRLFVEGDVLFDEMIAATEQPASRLCSACFDGNYPIELPGETALGKNVIEHMLATAARTGVPIQAQNDNASALRRP